MDRLTFVTVLGLLAAPLVAEAKPQTGKMPRIGMLLTLSPEHPQVRELTNAFREGLRVLGYVEGQNVDIEVRSAHGQSERLLDVIAELVRLNVDLIFVLGGTPAARAAKQANVTVPVVAPAMGDAVSDGLVASLRQPGGHITGSSFLGPGLVSKRLGLLKEAVPRASSVAALWHPAAYGDRTMNDMLKEIKAAAQTLRVPLQLVDAEGPSDFERAFSAMTRQHAGALIVLPSPMFYGEYSHIVSLAAKNRLPASYAFREAVEAGGLMSYGASLTDLFRRAATLS